MGARGARMGGEVREGGRDVVRTRNVGREEGGEHSAIPEHGAGDELGWEGRGGADLEEMRKEGE